MKWWIVLNRLSKSISAFRWNPVTNISYQDLHLFSAWSRGDCNISNITGSGSKWAWYSITFTVQCQSGELCRCAEDGRSVHFCSIFWKPRHSWGNIEICWSCINRSRSRMVQSRCQSPPTPYSHSSRLSFPYEDVVGYAPKPFLQRVRPSLSCTYVSTELSLRKMTGLDK